MSIQAGDRVKFRAGRGYSEGRVANTDGALATIETVKGKMVYRLVKSLAKLEPVMPVATPTIDVEKIPEEVLTNAVV